MILLLGTSLDGAQREIPVRLVVDSRSSPESIQMLQDGMQPVFRYFQDRYELALKIGPPMAWNWAGKADLDDAIFDLLNAFPGNQNGILLGLVAGADGGQASGMALYDEGVLVVRPGRDAASLETVLFHEMGHLFGAAHVPDRKSFMCPSLEGSGYDPVNREVMGLHLERAWSFDGPNLKRESYEKLAPLYQRMAVDVRAFRRDSKMSPLAWQRSGLENVFQYLASTCLHLERYPEAIEAANEALVINPELVEMHDLKGIAWRHQGELDKAIEQYHLALAKMPKYAKLHYNLGIAQMKKGDWNAAADSFRRALELNPGFVDARNNLGFVHLAMKDFAAAAEAFSAVLRIQPGHFLAQLNLAEARFRLGEYAEAMESALKAEALEGSEYRVFQLQGMIHRAAGRLPAAEASYRRALQIAPDVLAVHYNLGNLLVQMGRLAEALVHYRRALELDPRFAQGQEALADCLLALGDVAAAYRAYGSALSLGGDDSTLQRKMGSSSLKLGEWQRALGHFRRVLERSPGDGLALLNAGTACFLGNRLGDAEAYFVSASRVEATAQEAWSNLGSLYFGQKRFAEAAAAYRSYLERAPRDGRAHYGYGLCFLALKDGPQAYRELTLAMECGYPVKEEDLLAARQFSLPPR